MLVWYGLIFWILFIKILLGSLRSEKNKIRYLCLIGFALILIMGCRYIDTSLKGDLNNYARLYANLKYISWEDLFVYSDMEKGYLLLNKIFVSIFPWEQSILFIEAIICVYFSFKFIYKYCDDVFLGVLFYISQGLFIFELTGFRQAIAISLCLYAIEFVEKRKFIPFSIIMLLASAFHSTAILFFPFYFIALLKPGLKAYAIYFLFFMILIQIVPFLLNWGSDLTGNDYSQAGSWGGLIGPLINIVLYLSTLVLTYLTNKSNEIIPSWKWNMIITGIIVYLLRFISLPFERISFYFQAGVIVTLPTVLKKPFDKESYKLLYYMIIISSVILFLYRITTTVGPYKCFI